MSQHADRLRTPKRPPRKLPVSQSKFDRWLEERVELKVDVFFKFQVAPIDSHRHDTPNEWLCRVVTVDRYMVQLRFSDGSEWWTSKANILSARV